MRHDHAGNLGRVLVVGEGQTLLDIPDQGVLGAVAQSGEAGTEGAREAQRAQRLEGLVGTAQIQLDLLHLGAERRESVARLRQHGQHLGLDRQPVQRAQGLTAAKSQDSRGIDMQPVGCL
jgi:hypothetical protein